MIKFAKPKPVAPEEEILLTSKELRGRWKCHTVTLQRWVATGKLPTVTIGGLRRYRLSDIQQIEREGIS